MGRIRKKCCSKKPPANASGFLVEATGFEPATSASRTNVSMCYMVFFYFK